MATLFDPMAALGIGPAPKKHRKSKAYKKPDTGIMRAAKGGYLKCYYAAGRRGMTPKATAKACGRPVSHHPKKRKASKHKGRKGRK